MVCSEEATDSLMWDMGLLEPLTTRTGPGSFECAELFSCSHDQGGKADISRVASCLLGTCGGRSTARGK